MKALALLALLPAAESARIWSIVYYTGSNCNGEVVAYDNVPSLATNKCWQASPQAGARSAHIGQYARGYGGDFNGDYYDDYDGGYDDGYDGGSYHYPMLRFYDNKDCSNHQTDRHVIAEAWDSSCVSWEDTVGQGKAMKSFNIVKTGRLDIHRGVLSDQYSILKHGDRLKYRGREWRMQQVAAAFFREIPVEEWDDKVHLANTTHRFAEHEDIDAFGRHKFSKRYSSMYRIRLEWWDDTRENRPDDDYDYYDYDYDDGYGSSGSSHIHPFDTNGMYNTVDEDRDDDETHMLQQDLSPSMLYEGMKNLFCSYADDELASGFEDVISQYPEARHLCGEEELGEKLKHKSKSKSKHKNRKTKGLRKLASAFAGKVQETLGNLGF